MKNHSFSAKIDVFRGRFESNRGRFESNRGRFESDCCFKIKTPLFRPIFSYINTSKAVWQPRNLLQTNKKNSQTKKIYLRS